MMVQIYNLIPISFAAIPRSHVLSHNVWRNPRLSSISREMTKLRQEAPLEERVESENLSKRYELDKPMSWTQVVDIIHKQALHLLARSHDQEAEYQDHRDSLRKEWRHPIEFILHSKFGFDKRRIPESELWESSPSLHEITQTQVKLCPNDYPYYFEDGIEHWVLWKLMGNVTNDDIQLAKDELINLYAISDKAVKDMVHWVNPHHLKSLPEIDHAHILCLRSHP